MSMMFEVYKKGSRYPILMGEDRVVIDYTPSGLTMVIRYNRLTMMETLNLKNGPMSYGIFWDGEVIYFLFRFGTGKWIDASFHKNLTPDQNNIVQFTNDEECEALTIIAGEASTGECKVIRFVSLNREFSNKIREYIAMQHDDIVADAIYDRIGNTYRRYTTDQMVKNAEKNGNIY